MQSDRDQVGVGKVAGRSVIKLIMKAMVAVGVLVVVFTIFNKADGQAQGAAEGTPKGPKVTEKVSCVKMPCRPAICQTPVIAFLLVYLP